MGVAALVAIAAAGLTPRIAQPPEYSAFVDGRALLGVPNALHVFSNLPFAVVGLAGLAIVARARGRTAVFADDWDRWPYAVLFLAVAVTSLGSSYFHLAPDNWRLVWDRLPMTVGFMALLTARLAEGVNRPLARAALAPLLAAGALSVVYWYWREQQQAGDPRPYLVVQFGSLLLVLVLYPTPGRGTAYLVAGLAAYAAAKGLEAADGSIFLALGETVSGHTLKHLVAAGSVWCLIEMLRARRRDELLSAESRTPAQFLRPREWILSKPAVFAPARRWRVRWHGQVYHPFMAGSDSMPPSAEHDTRLTYDDLCFFPDDRKRRELIDGELFVTPAPTMRHQVLLGRLFMAVANYLAAHPDVGRVFLSPLDVVFSPYDVVEPDLLFVACDQFEILTPKNVQGSPALVVEILSPGTRKRDEQTKRRLFARTAVREYWIVDPDSDLIKVSRRAADGAFPRVVELSADDGDTLTSPLLAEFSLALSEFFAPT